MGACPPDSSQLAMGINNGITVAVPVVSGKNVSGKTPPTLLTFDGTWSPDGRYIATASGDTTAVVWKVGGG
ncbi:MAG TPA: WD40 repeat domain-containing protein [Ktedonobacteraceae bacterium]|nr:WD40 repeat domain-containing protein [Ktedonobacteraceae bacterium]